MRHLLLVKYFGEVLPYLETRKETNESIEELRIPNVTGISLKEAEGILKEMDLEIEIKSKDGVELESIDKESVIVEEQIPPEGINVKKGSKVILKY